MKRIILLFAAILPFVLLTSCYRKERVKVGDTVNGIISVDERTGEGFPGGLSGLCWVGEKTKDSITLRFFSHVPPDVKWEEETRQLADDSEAVTRKYWAVMSSREVPKDKFLSIYKHHEQWPMPSADWTGPVIEFQGDELPDDFSKNLTVEENRALAANIAAFKKYFANR
ncbi:MAG: hypothetical protein CMP26_08410 [Roseibacillus sp.]|nr:hypothetical protein [Roseibacillus sp.]|tara:strand:- start:14 stop:523 length:510 start_codon:yes stop_codon:yes gene_type:complete